MTSAGPVMVTPDVMQALGQFTYPSNINNNNQQPSVQPLQPQLLSHQPPSTELHAQQNFPPPNTTNSSSQPHLFHPNSQQPAYQRQRPQNIQINPNSANAIFFQQQQNSLNQMNVGTPIAVADPNILSQNQLQPAQNMSMVPLHLQKTGPNNQFVMVNTPQTLHNNMDPFKNNANLAGQQPIQQQPQPAQPSNFQTSASSNSSGSLASAAAAAVLSTRQNFLRNQNIPHLRRSVSATTPTALQFTPTDLHLVSPNSSPIFPNSSSNSTNGYPTGLGVTNINIPNNTHASSPNSTSAPPSSARSSSSSLSTPGISTFPNSVGLMAPVVDGSAEDGMPPLISPTLSPYMSVKFSPDVKRYHNDGLVDETSTNNSNNNSTSEINLHTQFVTPNLNAPQTAPFDSKPKRRRSNANTVLEVPRRHSLENNTNENNANIHKDSSASNLANVFNVIPPGATGPNAVGTVHTYPSPTNSTVSSAGSNNTPTATPTLAVGNPITLTAATNNNPNNQTTIVTRNPGVFSANNTPTNGSMTQFHHYPNQQQYIQRRSSTAVAGNRYTRSPITATSAGGTGALTGMFSQPLSFRNHTIQNQGGVPPDSKSSSLPSSTISTPVTQHFSFGNAVQNHVFPLDSTTHFENVSGDPSSGNSTNKVAGSSLSSGGTTFGQFTNFAAAPSGGWNNSNGKPRMNMQGGVEGKFEVLTFHQYEVPKEKKSSKKEKSEKKKKKEEGLGKEKSEEAHEEEDDGKEKASKKKVMKKKTSASKLVKDDGNSRRVSVVLEEDEDNVKTTGNPKESKPTSNPKKEVEESLNSRDDSKVGVAADLETSKPAASSLDDNTTLFSTLSFAGSNNGSSAAVHNKNHTQPNNEDSTIHSIFSMNTDNTTLLSVNMQDIMMKCDTPTDVQNDLNATKPSTVSDDSIKESIGLEDMIQTKGYLGMGHDTGNEYRTDDDIMINTVGNTTGPHVGQQEGLMVTRGGDEELEMTEITDFSGLLMSDMDINMDMIVHEHGMRDDETGYGLDEKCENGMMVTFEYPGLGDPELNVPVLNGTELDTGMGNAGLEDTGFNDIADTTMREGDDDSKDKSQFIGKDKRSTEEWKMW